MNKSKCEYESFVQERLSANRNKIIEKHEQEIRAHMANKNIKMSVIGSDCSDEKIVPDNWKQDVKTFVLGYELADVILFANMLRNNDISVETLKNAKDLIKLGYSFAMQDLHKSFDQLIGNDNENDKI